MQNSNGLLTKHAAAPEGCALLIDNVLFPPSDSIVVLGSVICANGDEAPAIRHRISAAWACFHKWSHILTSTAPLLNRLHFWDKTVGKSLIWGLQTLRSQEKSKTFRSLLTCQKQQVRKMMKVKRRVQEDGSYEPWLDWHVRSFHAAGNAIRNAGLDLAEHFLCLRRSWAGHLCRLGTKSGEQHPVKHILLWRPLSWWRLQQAYNQCGQNAIFHPPGWGYPKRWEGGFPEDWVLNWSKQ